MKISAAWVFNKRRAFLSGSHDLPFCACVGFLALLFCASPRVLVPAIESRAGDQLERVLKQMDDVGKKFRSFTAGFTAKKYTAVLQEFDTPESGKFYYARAKDGSALLRREQTSPADKVLTIKGGVLTVYQPGIKQAQIVSLGKNKDKAEFLALGIGQSPAKLQETFDIGYQGTETINGSECAALVLKPKSQSVAAYFSSVTLWIKRSNGIPIQQKLQEPSGDYVLMNFFDERLNLDIPASEFEQKLPKGVEVFH